GSITSSFAPGFDPMILVYFEGKIQDIMILAHEIGHGIHTILSNQKQTYFNSEYSTVTAEMASLHCETIVFEYVIQTIDNPIERLNLLISKFDSDCYSLFTTGFGYYQFEKKMYNMHKQQGIILAKQARDFWRTEYLESVFGDTIKFTSGAEHGWQGVSHLSLVFYNYAYASGLLFAKHIYKEIHENPTKKHIYKEILGLGGSMTPAELMKKIDFDIEGREFWEEGFDIMKNNLKVIRKEWIQLKSLSSQKAHKLGIKKSGTTLTPGIFTPNTWC
ncbi:MAG: hypothetical protein H7196_00160, partial [candidate division SR1 bacterium]|nr:hypothetical protein [candidate division SR1 bacterium]